MFYTIYKTTNQINGKFYIGCHKTKDLDDKYLGSGKLLRRAIEKHGVENFVREILHVFDNPADAFAKEAEIVTEEFLSENNCYNLKLGGEGGFDWINSQEDNSTRSSEHYSKMLKRRKELYPNGTFLGKKQPPGWYDKAIKTNPVVRGEHRGEKNSVFGKKRATNGVQNKVFPPDATLPVGWRWGMTKKHK